MQMCAITLSYQTAFVLLEHIFCLKQAKYCFVLLKTAHPFSFTFSIAGVFALSKKLFWMRRNVFFSRFPFSTVFLQAQWFNYSISPNKAHPFQLWAALQWRSKKKLSLCFWANRQISPRAQFCKAKLLLLLDCRLQYQALGISLNCLSKYSNQLCKW